MDSWITIFYYSFMGGYYEFIQRGEEFGFIKDSISSLQNFLMTMGGGMLALLGVMVAGFALFYTAIFSGNLKEVNTGFLQEAKHTAKQTVKTIIVIIIAYLITPNIIELFTHAEFENNVLNIYFYEYYFGILIFIFFIIFIFYHFYLTLLDVYNPFAVGVEILEGEVHLVKEKIQKQEIKEESVQEESSEKK